jgi:hypothetical protein
MLYSIPLLLTLKRALMVNIIKPIDIISPADGRRYTSTREYERALHSKGQDVMTDKSFRETRERILDTERSAPKAPPERYNHVHIDFANGRVTKSKRDLDV